MTTSMHWGIYANLAADANRQGRDRTLLWHGLRRPGASPDGDPRVEFDASLRKRAVDQLDGLRYAALALGAGATDALIDAADQEHDLRRTQFLRCECPRPSGTLVLLAPALPDDAFAGSHVAFEPALRALAMYTRVVVLYCPQDRTVATHMVTPNPGARPCMASAGLAAGSDPRVELIDISGLIEERADCIRGALCSYEALGLIVRLLAGIPPQAAVTPMARVVKTAN